MKRDPIIDLALQAGIRSQAGMWVATPAELRRFAALIAKALKAQLKENRA